MIDKKTSYLLRDNSLISQGKIVGFQNYREEMDAYLSRIEILKLLGDYPEYIDDINLNK